MDRSPLVVRALGALIGGGFGVLLLGLAAANTTWYGGPTQYAYGVLVLVLGGSLGWLFAPRAARPGTLNVAGTAGLITALAVPIGALLFTLLLLLGAIADSGVGGFARFGVLEVVGGVVGIGLFGLVLYGLPMAGLTFVVASIWVFLVRFAAARLGGGRPGSAPEPSGSRPT
jgi:hypothetical protein